MSEVSAPGNEKKLILGKHLPEKHHKDTFEKISGQKQERILHTAISEFAGKGYVAANINVIAQKIATS